MIKHADSFNFFQALKQQQEHKRDKELAPAWWTYTLDPASLARTQLIERPLQQALIAGAHKHVLPGKDDLKNFLDQSGMDLRGAEVNSFLGPNYQFIPKEHSLMHKMLGLAAGKQGEHGTVLRHFPSEKPLAGGSGWDIPLLAHEVGHSQAYYKGNIPEKFFSRTRGSANMLGTIGAMIESYRALDDNPRSLDERKRMLNTGSAIAGLSGIPILANEYHASRNGLRLLENMALENKGEIIGAAKKFYPKAFSTYALMAAAPMMAPQIAKLFLPKHVS